ncbi:MAG: hypothetical protein JRH11_16990 [Deltaproteobacteria bacterium]|nr:hypothetical protein [Deltaproteobacteria bacterium]
MALVLSGACDGGCACGSSVAELVDAQGPVTRDFAGKEDQWEAAEVGTTFAVGDAVRTAPEGSEARVVLTSGGGLELAPGTIVRFLAAAPNDEQGERVNVEMGEARVSAGQSGLVIAGSFGEAQLLGGGEMRISAADGTVMFEVLMGGARLEPADGDFVELGAGEELVLDVEFGSIIIDEADADPPDTGPADTGASVVVDPGAEVAITMLRGRVEIADAEGAWSRIPRGTTAVPAGSRVRLRRRARLSAAWGGGTVGATGPAEMILGPAGGAVASIQSGRATASAGAEDSVIEVPGGSFVSKGGATGAQATVRIAPNGSATVASRAGLVTLRGRTENYGVHEGGHGVIRANGSLDVSGRPPARAHMAITAGASAILHDPGGTVNVQVRFGDFCGGGEGVIEVASGRSYQQPFMRSFGTGKANISARPGATRYRLRCASGGTPTGDAVAQGTLTVRRDSGQAQLPRRPARNVVDTDGRRYSIHYQNILPIVTVRWRGAPSTRRFVLHVGERTFATSTANHALESGQVPEGTHQVFYEAPGGRPGRSPVTTLNVRYDNATTAAYIREPAAGSSVSGSVRVSGTCVAGCTVSVGGQNLPLGGAHRFSGQATVPAGLDALAIRVSHPRSGVHYYLRRTGSR